jgi:lipoprotein-anchoring transpeptidase ErfK/SrfK
MKIVPPGKGIDATAVNNPQTRDLVGPKSQGAAVIRAQILLDRAHFSPGEIDGRYGRNLRSAIVAYQQQRGLPATGLVDEPTWSSLNVDTAQVLVSYTITPIDVMQEFRKIPKTMKEQSALDYLGYESPAEALGERFHIDPDLLMELNPSADFGTAGETIVAPDVVRPYGVVQAARLVVSKATSAVTAFDANGGLIAHYPATLGSKHDPLPLGSWFVTTVQQSPWFHYNPDLFWDADPNDTRLKIAPGPNSPVGLVWIGLSKEHYGIHGAPEPGKIGHTASHGCIRLTNWDAEELSQMIGPGVPVLLTE